MASVAELKTKNGVYYYLVETINGKSVKTAYLGTKYPLPKGLARTNLPTEWIERLKRKAIDRTKRKKASVSAVKEFPRGSGIITGDYSILFKLLPDDSVDLFFTDPPYSEKFISLYTGLAELSQQKLRPGGLCLAYTPHAHLADIVKEMTKQLDYWWIFGINQTGLEARIWVHRLWVGWKPIVAFTKRPTNGRLTTTWLRDWFRGEGEDKRFHEWGQDIREASYWIENLCPKRGIVVDPFCGGGTIPLAAKLNKRKWLATENNKKTAAIARQRLSNG